MRLNRRIINCNQKTIKIPELAVKIGYAIVNNDNFWYNNSSTAIAWSGYNNISNYMNNNKVDVFTAIKNTGGSFHCSYFASAIYNLAGIKDLRTTQPEVYGAYGFEVVWADSNFFNNSNNLKVGDILFSQDSSNHYLHVAIYAGKNKMIQALNADYGIIESNYAYDWQPGTYHWTYYIRYKG